MGLMDEFNVRFTYYADDGWYAFIDNVGGSASANTPLDALDRLLTSLALKQLERETPDDE